MPPLHGIDGSGSGVPTPSLQLGLVASGSCLTLAEYASIIEYDEHRFFGVNRNDWLAYQCREYWSRMMRQNTQHYLSAAQSLIEAQLMYKLCPTWIADEEYSFATPLESKWTHAIEPGVMATTFIEEGSAVDHTADPSVIGPIVTTVTDESEVVVFHPGTSEVITPQSVVISGGSVTIYIPRCRMVPIASQYETVNYDVVGNFLATVDVVRVYNDPSINAEVAWPHSCSSSCGSNCSCSETTHTACMTLLNRAIGKWKIVLATYSSGWTAVAASCSGRPHAVRLNYRAGLTELPHLYKEAVIRLAHSLMPAPPCGCESIKNVWRRDRNVPLVTDRERLNCPFGLSDGAWFAWNIATNRQTGWMGVL